MSKWRTWRLPESYHEDAPDDGADPYVEVIEIGAVKELEVERDEWEKRFFARDEDLTRLTRISNTVDALIKERDQLRAENERLKYEITCYRLDGPAHTLAEENAKLRAALEKISRFARADLPYGTKALSTEAQMARAALTKESDGTT